MTKINRAQLRAMPAFVRRAVRGRGRLVCRGLHHRGGRPPRRPFLLWPPMRGGGDTMRTLLTLLLAPLLFPLVLLKALLGLS